MGETPLKPVFREAAQLYRKLSYLAGLAESSEYEEHLLALSGVALAAVSFHEIQSLNIILAQLPEIWLKTQPLSNPSIGRVIKQLKALNLGLTQPPRILSYFQPENENPDHSPFAAELPFYDEYAERVFPWFQDWEAIQICDRELAWNKLETEVFLKRCIEAKIGKIVNKKNDKRRKKRGTNFLSNTPLNWDSDNNENNIIISTLDCYVLISDCDDEF